VEIILVRHAESTSNVSRRWQGQGDAPLSAHGETQAAALAARLAERRRNGWRVDVILSSDLMRAANTARASFADRVSTDPSWREADVGAWEGLTRAEVAERFPEELSALGEGRRDVALGGGESLERFWGRVDAALERLRAQLTPDGRAIVFTHGGVIGAVVAHALGKRAMRASSGLGRLANTAMTTLHYDAGHSGARLIGLNDTAHLGAAAVAAEERRDGALPLIRLIANDALVHAPESDAAQLEAAGGSRDAIVAVLRRAVSQSGAEFTLQLQVSPRALHAIVVALAHVPAERHGALVLPQSAQHSHIVLDPRLGATVIDHAISPHKV
jgi:broad specificity phosphatase PhoE